MVAKLNNEMKPSHFVKPNPQTGDLKVAFQKLTTDSKKNNNHLEKFLHATYMPPRANVEIESKVVHLWFKTKS